MEIRFRQSVSGREATLVARDDGVGLSVPVYGKLDPLPHDLAHYVVERELGLPDGFWGSVAAEAIFAGMVVLDGRQPPHARAVMKANQRGILFSEVMVDAVVRAAHGESLGAGPLAVESAHAPSRTRADRDALIARLLPPMRAMRARWWAVPEGEGLPLDWPAQPARRARRHAARR